MIGAAASLYYLRHREWAYQEALEEEGLADEPEAEPIRRGSYASR